MVDIQHTGLLSDSSNVNDYSIVQLYVVIC